MKSNKTFLKYLKTRPDGQAHLLSTMEDFSHEDYLEWCEMNGIESPGDKDSFEFHEWCRRTARDYYEADLENCRHAKALQRKFVVTGTLGLWWGNPAIVPVLCDDFDEVVTKVTGRDTLDLTATYDTDGIHFSCSHHDGTNVFDVYLVKDTADLDRLRERIDETFDPAGRDRRFLEKITDYIF